MKIRLRNNAELVIESNPKKDDFGLVLRVAERIVKQDDGLEIAAVEKDEFVHLTAVWDNFQAEDWKHAYRTAKKSILEES